MKTSGKGWKREYARVRDGRERNTTSVKNYKYKIFTAIPSSGYKILSTVEMSRSGGIAQTNQNV